MPTTSVFFSLKEKLLRQQDKNSAWNYLPWAESCSLIEGEGYNPYFKQEMLDDLAIQLESAEGLIERWQRGEFKSYIKTEKKIWMSTCKRGTSGRFHQKFWKKIKSTEPKRPNLISFLFGSKKKKRRAVLETRRV